MKKLNTEYWKKLLETVAFSSGKISMYELVQKEHRHFHPSGITRPSKEDINFTTRIKKAGELIGVRLLDHIIIGNGFISLKEKELL